MQWTFVRWQYSGIHTYCSCTSIQLHRYVYVGEKPTILPNCMHVCGQDLCIHYCIAHVRTNNDVTSLASRHTTCVEYSHSVGYSVSSNALYGRLSMCVHVCTIWIYQNCIVLVGHVDNNMYAMQIFFVRTRSRRTSVHNFGGFMEYWITLDLT